MVYKSADVVFLEKKHGIMTDQGVRPKEHQKLKLGEWNRKTEPEISKSDCYYDNYYATNLGDSIAS